MTKSFSQKKKNSREFRARDNSLFAYYGFTKGDEKKYPVITKILKQLTPENIKKANESIQKINLPPEIQKWVNEYNKVGERNEYIWKWAFFVSNNIKLPFIANKYDQTISHIKFLLIMLITLIDDMADRKRNLHFLEKISNFSLIGNNPLIRNFNIKAEDMIYFRKVFDVWIEIKKLLVALPNFKEIAMIIDFDFKQIWNSMLYACIVNINPSLNNKEENRIYLSHSTPAILSYMIDLCCAHKKVDIGKIRSVGWYCQMMVRIANTIATHKRERLERDLSGEINIYKNIKKKNNIERDLLQQWDEYYKTVSRLLDRFNTKIKKNILHSLEKLLVVHLSSRGKI